MKKYFVLILLLAFTTVGAFALDVGIGLMLGERTLDNYRGIYNSDNNFGLTGFFGWKYFDFTVGLSNHSHSYGFHAGFDIKFPITSYKIRIFPIIGTDLYYSLYNDHNDIYYDDDGYYYYVGYYDDEYEGYIELHGGVGVDVHLIKNMFVRSNLLYDFFNNGFSIKACACWRF